MEEIVFGESKSTPMIGRRSFRALRVLNLLLLLLARENANKELRFVQLF
jgi:hypothetical protein